jgi:hypothetical protein
MPSCASSVAFFVALLASALMLGPALAHAFEANAPKRNVVRANDPDIIVARSEIHPHPGLIDQ